ncbi:MAG: sulfotransferase family 2 domain-containing protein [Gaiellaceae bacterium]
MAHCSLHEAQEMMTSNHWTRAIFVREPKERFLSAYLDKVIQSNYVKSKCCQPNRVAEPAKCFEEAQNFKTFLNITEACYDIHWVPQSMRMDSEFLPYINFVGRYESLANDTMKLLKSLRNAYGEVAWDTYGKSGWGKDGMDAIYQGTKSHHATNAGDNVKQYYTPEVERMVEEAYRDDYILFNFTRKFA